VSLGANAIANIASAVSGSVVSISNFPASQPISGTVTVGNTVTIAGAVAVSNQPSEIVIKGYDIADDEYEVLRTDSDGILYVTPNGAIDVKLRDGSSNLITSTTSGAKRGIDANIISSSITVSGTVTANVPLVSNQPADQATAIPVVLISDEGKSVFDTDQQLPVRINSTAITMPISGTVTASLRPPEVGYNTFISQSGSDSPAFAVGIGYNTASNTEFLAVNDSGNNLPVSVGNSVTIGSLPTLAPQLPRVTFIDGSGTVVTANSAVTLFASSTTRSYLLVQVTTGSAFVNVGATATTVNGINLTAGQGYAWETTIPQGAVSLISTTTSSRWVAKEA
jgi:hypothetical protein